MAKPRKSDKPTGFAFEERRRGRGWYPGQAICVRAVSATDARGYARGSMMDPKYRGRCSGKETVNAVTDAARAWTRRHVLYPDEPHLW